MNAAASPDVDVAKASDSADRRQRLLVVFVPTAVCAAAVLAVLPVIQVQLPEQPSFVPVMIALITCFDVLSVVLLLGQFRDTGEPRALALSWAYLGSLVVLLGWAGAFPGVLGSPAPLGSVPSTAPWLWVAWHTLFPVLLAVALGPWPRSVPSVVPRRRRAAWAWSTSSAAAAVGLLIVGLIVTWADHLPVMIIGTDTSPTTRVAGPVMFPVVVAATAVTVLGAWRRGGAVRWAGVAALATLADVVLTLIAQYRFSVGWYAGRTLAVVSAGVVLVALLGEFTGIKRRLALEGERLAAVLRRTDRLERLQDTLLSHMADGVLMQDGNGAILACNPTAHTWLGLSADDLRAGTAFDPRPRALAPDGSPWGDSETPTMRTLRTGEPLRREVVGIRTDHRSLRWLSMSTGAVLDGSGEVEYVVTSINDVTGSHADALTAARVERARRDRIHRVLHQGQPRMVFQPIVEMATGRVVGVEALARFPGWRQIPPNQWFAEAAEVGLGVDLELAAVENALAQLDRLPGDTYLSFNAGPETVLSRRFRSLVHSVAPARLVIELTEHADVADYSALTNSLGSLRNSGVRVAVDDAGAGFSSLQHILNLRPDIIKLDRALVSGVDADPARHSLAAALVTFANEIGARVIAEGIENNREHTVLRRLGVRYGQGFHFARPGPLPLLTAFCDRAKAPLDVDGR